MVEESTCNFSVLCRGVIAWRKLSTIFTCRQLKLSLNDVSQTALFHVFYSTLCKVQEMSWRQLHTGTITAENIATSKVGVLSATWSRHVILKPKP